MLRLTIIDDDGRELHVPLLRDTISIGRKADNTIRLSERNISRYHALISRETAALFIEDLDSYNGVLLNGNQVARKTALYPGDIVEIGDYKLRLEEIDAPAEAIAPPAETPPPPAGSDAAELPHAPGVNVPPTQTQSDETLPEAPETTPASERRTVMLEAVAPEPEQKSPAERERPPAETDDTATPDDDIEEMQDFVEEDDEDEADEPPMPEAPAPEKPEPARTRPNPSSPYDSGVYGALNDDFPRASRKGWFIAVVLFAMIAGVAVWLWPDLANKTPSPDTAEPPLVAVPLGQVAEDAPAAPAVDDVTAKKRLEARMAERRREIVADADRAGAKEADLKEQLIRTALAEARVQLAAQRWGDAIDTLNILLADLPDVPEALDLRRQAESERKNLRAFDGGLKLLSKDKPFKAIGLLAQVDENSVYAERAAQKLEVAKRRAAAEHTRQGWGEYRSKRYRSALSKAEQALGLVDDYEDAVKLADAARTQLAKAPKTQAKAESEPKDTLTPRQHYNVAANHFNKGRYQKAIDHFKAAIAIEPGYAYAWRGLGSVYAQVRRYEEAAGAYERYLKLKPKAADAEQVRRIVDQYKQARGNQ